MSYLIKIWTDGSCWNSHPEKLGGWCAIIAAIPTDVEITEDDIAEQASFSLEMAASKAKSTNELTGLSIVVIKGYEEDTTNNRMEMTAVIEAVRSFKKKCALTITTDSEYTINMFSRNYKPKVNQDLIKEWKKVSKGFRIAWVHVDGHSGNQLNELCDEIADYKRGEFHEQ